MRPAVIPLVLLFVFLGGCGGEEGFGAPVPVSELPPPGGEGAALDPEVPLPDDNRCVRAWRSLLLSDVSPEVWDLAGRVGVVRLNPETRGLEILIEVGDCAPSPDGCTLVWERHSDHVRIVLDWLQGGLPVSSPDRPRPQIAFYNAQLHITHRGVRLSVDERGVWTGGVRLAGKELVRRMEAFGIAHPVSEEIWEVGNFPRGHSNRLVRPFPDGTYESTSESCGLAVAMRRDAEELLHIRNDGEVERLRELRMSHQPLWDDIARKLAAQQPEGGCEHQLLTLLEAYIRFQPYEPFQEDIEDFKLLKLAFRLGVNPEEFLRALMKEHERLWAALPPDADRVLPLVGLCPGGD